MHVFKAAFVGGVALATLTACASQPDVDEFPAGSVISDVPEALIDDRSDFLQAWGQEDLDETIEHFKDDARLLTQDGRTLSGHAQLRTWLADQFAVIEDLRLDRTEFERSEYEIIETGRYSIDVAPPGQTAQTMAGEYTIQWEYEGDDYLIQEMTIEQGF